MFKIDVYHSGSAGRVRLHHHPYGADERCGDECSYEAAERAYPKHRGDACDYRKALVAAVVAVMLDPAVGHVEWAFLAGEQMALDL